MDDRPRKMNAFLYMLVGGALGLGASGLFIGMPAPIYWLGAAATTATGALLFLLLYRKLIKLVQRRPEDARKLGLLLDFALTAILGFNLGVDGSYAFHLSPFWAGSASMAAMIAAATIPTLLVPTPPDEDDFVR